MVSRHDACPSVYNDPRAQPEVREIPRNYHRFALFHCIQKWVSFNDPCGKSSRNWSSHLIIRHPKSSRHTWCLEPLKAFRLKKLKRDFNSHPSSAGICLGSIFSLSEPCREKNRQNKPTWNWSVPCTSLCGRVISPTRNGPSFLCEPGYVVDSEDGFAKQKNLKNWEFGRNKCVFRNSLNQTQRPLDL